MTATGSRLLAALHLAAGYTDRTGAPITTGDTVTVTGHDGRYRVGDIRPERVAVIANTAPGFPYTSTVPLGRLTVVPEPADLPIGTPPR